MIELIKDEQLELSDVPENNDISATNKFAHTFNGYEKSLEDMVKVGKSVLSKLKLNETDDLGLTEIRKSLFYYFRRERHNSSLVPEVHIVNTYLNLIRKRIIERKRN